MRIEEIGNKETEPYIYTYITETETVTEAETFNEETEEPDTYSVCVD